MDIIQLRLMVRFIHVFLDLIFVLMLWFRVKSKAAFHLGLAFLFLGIYAGVTQILEFAGADRLFLARLQWLIILAFPALIIFVYYFTDNAKYIKLKILFWYFPAIVIAFLALATDYLIVSVYPVAVLGPLDHFARAYFIILGAPVSFYYLVRGYLESRGDKRWQLKYFIMTAVFFVGGKITALAILPILYPSHGFTYYIIDDILSIVTILLSVYVFAFKKAVFDVRVVLTEILVGAIALILLVQTFLAQEAPLIALGLVTFFFFLFAGYLLIEATRKEIQRKEEVEKLADELKGFNQILEQKVGERTKELETSYREIKSRKDDLERFYNLAVGRELRMAELKGEAEKLKNNKPTGK